MFDADDIRAGVRVLASNGRYGTPYRCPICKKLVKLRRQRGRRVHFVHVAGQADPDCIRYTQERLSSISEVSRSTSPHSPSFTIGNLHFGFSRRGAEFAIELPIVDEPLRKGTMLIACRDLEIPIDLTHISKGFRAFVPLDRGRFEVRANSSVPPEVVELLRASKLEADDACVLFYAQQEGYGRRVGDSETVEAGSALWAVVVAASRVLEPYPEDVLHEHTGVYGDKEVVSILLPRTHDREKLEELSDWLGLQVDAPSVAVWIEQPLPAGRHQTGPWYYVVSGEEFHFCSDGPGILTLRNISTGNASESLERRGRTWIWARARLGEWHVYYDGEPVVAFHTLASVPLPNTLMHVQLDNEASGSLYATETALRTQSPPPAFRVLSVHIGCPELRSAVLVNGAPCAEFVAADKVVLNLDQALTIEARNFGRLNWIPVDRDSVVMKAPDAILNLARWLLSVSTPYRNQSSLRFTAVAQARLLPHLILERLRTCSWDYRFQPQLNWLSHALRSLK